MTGIPIFLRTSLLATCIAACAVARAQATGNANAASPLQTANPAAAQATAAAIEACSARMQTLLAALDRHDYPGAEADFDDTMRAGLTPDQLRQAWESLPQQYGAPGARGAPHNSTSGGYNVITVPMPFQKGMLAAQIACGADGRIAGFHVMTLSPAAPPVAGGSAAAPASSTH